MDCSVIESKKYPAFFIISTTDFFYPNVQNPYNQGKVACANVLSDMYALGVVDVDNVLMLLASSSNIKNVEDRNIVTRQFIKGFDDTCREADTQVSGGQTVVNPWPIIGGVAKSMCRETDFILPVNGVVGDVIVLTKPLGTQLAVNIRQWISSPDISKFDSVKDVITKEEGRRAFLFAERSMMRLNRTAAKLMHKYGAHAATDITGFGIIGHADNLCKNQKANVSFVIHTLPIIRGIYAVARKRPGFRLLEGFSAETSGGLFVLLPKDRALLFCQELEAIDRCSAWIIGDVVQGDRTVSILPNVRVIEVE